MNPSLRDKNPVQHTFLGAEFLTHLFFDMHHCGGEYTIDKQAIRLGMGNSVVLKIPSVSQSRVSIQGPRLDDSGEILQAFRSGAWIEHIALELNIAERKYNFTLNAKDASISQLKIRQNFEEEDKSLQWVAQNEDQESESDISTQETIFLRLAALVELENVIDFLFARFLKKRLDIGFVTGEFALMRRTVQKGLLAKVEREAAQETWRQSNFDADKKDSSPPWQ